MPECRTPGRCFRGYGPSVGSSECQLRNWLVLTRSTSQRRIVLFLCSRIVLSAWITKCCGKGMVQQVEPVEPLRKCPRGWIKQQGARLACGVLNSGTYLYSWLSPDITGLSRLTLVPPQKKIQVPKNPCVSQLGLPPNGHSNKEQMWKRGFTHQTSGYPTRWCPQLKVAL
jgi:hypothetical protein